MFVFTHFDADMARGFADQIVLCVILLSRLAAAYISPERIISPDAVGAGTSRKCIGFLAEIPVFVRADGLGTTTHYPNTTETDLGVPLGTNQIVDDGRHLYLCSLANGLTRHSRSPPYASDLVYSASPCMGMGVVAGYVYHIGNVSKTVTRYLQSGSLASSISITSLPASTTHAHVVSNVIVYSASTEGPPYSTLCIRMRDLSTTACGSSETITTNGAPVSMFGHGDLDFVCVQEVSTFAPIICYYISPLPQ